MSKETYEELVARQDDEMGIGPKSDAAANEVLKCLNGHRASAILALVYEKLNCPELDIEWTLEVFWANKIRNIIPTLEKIYSELVKRNITEENKHDFNDDHIWFVPDPRRENRRIFIHTAQNTNFIFVWDEKCTDPELGRYGRLHVRRYWDVLPEPEYEWDIKDDVTFKEKVAKHGKLWALRESGLENYADDVLDKPYPDRPSLDFFKKSNFEFRYGDGRDKGYVLSYQRNSNKVDWALIHHGEIKIITESYIPSITCELFEEEE
jgi:hypothetical protein